VKIPIEYDEFHDAGPDIRLSGPFSEKIPSTRVLLVHIGVVIFLQGENCLYIDRYQRDTQVLLIYVGWEFINVSADVSGI
jgi:hypothetical protein